MSRRVSAVCPRVVGGTLTLLAGLLGVSALALPANAAAGPVGLGTATSFAVLAGSGITNTGATVITGDIGTFPTTTETDAGSIALTGTDQGGDAVTQGAKADLLTAYNDAAGEGPTTAQPTELGGSTLDAGVYGSPTFGLTGTLTLDGQGNPDAEFVFKAGTTLTTATGSHILLINGANACHVVWQIGSSATFGTNSQFTGDVLAATSITATTGATFDGRLLAEGGAVTLDTNTITTTTCPPPVTPTPTPTVTPTATATPTVAPTTGAGASSSAAAAASAAAARSAAQEAAAAAAAARLRAGEAAAAAAGGAGGTGGAAGSDDTGTGTGSASDDSTAPNLPFTGTPAAALAATGTALLAIGLTAVACTTRRRQH